MADTTPPKDASEDVTKDTDTAQELDEASLDEVAGGLNPQPLPPRAPRN